MDDVFTIGHSTHPIGRFLDLLAAHRVTVVADVRSHPASRFNPQFNRERLRASLSAAGLEYTFLGHQLGARPDDESCYVDGRAEYDLLARTPAFREGLAWVAREASRQRIALLCAEQDPLACHRAILVCRHLAALGIEARHILADGRLERHDEALERLLAECGVASVAEAYSHRGQRIAYTR
jgi:uncharacterized protein (DUF488 family)